MADFPDRLPFPLNYVPPVQTFGTHPVVQGAIRSAARSAVEPFGLLGRVMTGNSQEPVQDAAMGVAGLLGGPGLGAMKAAGAALAGVGASTLKGIAERVLGAAVTGINGEIFHAPNHLLAREAAAAKFGVHPDDVWGHLEPDIGRFLTSKGRMVDRVEAGKIAGQAGPLFAENNPGSMAAKVLMKRAGVAETTLERLLKGVDINGPVERMDIALNRGLIDRLPPDARAAAVEHHAFQDEISRRIDNIDDAIRGAGHEPMDFAFDNGLRAKAPAPVQKLMSDRDVLVGKLVDTPSSLR